jgi:hypothetical protein
MVRLLVINTKKNAVTAINTQRVKASLEEIAPAAIGRS